MGEHGLRHAQRSAHESRAREEAAAGFGPGLQQLAFKPYCIKPMNAARLKELLCQGPCFVDKGNLQKLPDEYLEKSLAWVLLPTHSLFCKAFLSQGLPQTPVCEGFVGALTGILWRCKICSLQSFKNLPARIVTFKNRSCWQGQATQSKKANRSNLALPQQG